MRARKREGREVSPSVGVLDNQAVKAAEAEGVGGYDAGRKMKNQGPRRRSCRAGIDTLRLPPVAPPVRRQRLCQEADRHRKTPPRLRGEAGRGGSGGAGLQARRQVTSSSRRSITESTSRIFWPRLSSRGPSLTEYSAAARPLRPVLATL